MIGYHYRPKTYYILENVKMNRYCATWKNV